MELFAVASPLGPLALTLKGDAVTRLEFPRSPRTGATAQPTGNGPRSPAGERVTAALGAYFAAGKPPALTLRPGGTAFQQRVWEALRAIPAGETATYGELAARAGSPRAARAVGQACARNPIPVLIPCHRAVGSSGPGGWSGQPGAKKWLLAHEASGGK
ncbi:MAG: cysteine methyltransferase [Euryarchaeota archaeon]|jgi:methylated-DNA-[protein]-cysteine S-methyltransferase|nr:cysteine methyltransferase [Euryarchaeota archaeon]MDP6363445.1 methylated-DNA--[protein]-cysteine S-methyltransferase [Candidatus Poseidoniia archaeon]MDP6658608.1 methylated-DNA--[protein]-cysteine S-methyltransferase [Candidatus Poseidoniia archaeon]MDP6846044.1 methylated-DNA--[protein]-cysteine S-methyltransferase [Candidatus Poseidoniia archaeon]MDP7006810.1 methylated-DNA--[protein]-cysteine S-methyltransferase [Candidatus Poseidoniia archaeon]|tara:strand:+ start:2075 stop:2551 length:477 start_codon:yes stop_codon:yes gene_type:complete